jgi:hypothetical protein
VPKPWDGELTEGHTNGGMTTQQIRKIEETCPVIITLCLTTWILSCNYLRCYYILAVVIMGVLVLMPCN